MLIDAHRFWGRMGAAALTGSPELFAPHGWTEFQNACTDECEVDGVDAVDGGCGPSRVAPMYRVGSTTDCWAAKKPIDDAFQEFYSCPQRPSTEICILFLDPAVQADISVNRIAEEYRESGLAGMRGGVVFMFVFFAIGGFNIVFWGTACGCIENPIYKMKVEEAARRRRRNQDLSRQAREVGKTAPSSASPPTTSVDLSVLPNGKDS